MPDLKSNAENENREPELRNSHHASSAGTGFSFSHFSTVFIFLTGALFYWAALPPLGIWPLVFFVPVAWTVPLLRKESIKFRTVYLTALVFWLTSIWWIACPHPLTIFGLIALAAYLSSYWTLFFYTTRTAVHRFRLPVVLAAPICWIGCEYLRNHLLGGFSFCSLEHALYLQPRFIQIADIGGGYLVGGMIMLVGIGFGIPLAAALEKSDDKENARTTLPRGLFSAILAVTVLLASVFYGIESINRPIPENAPRIRVAVLQGNIPVRLESDAEKSRTQAEETFKQFLDLTYKAVKRAKEEGRPLDWVIWPETVCPIPALYFQGKTTPSDVGWTDEQAGSWKDQLLGLVRTAGVPILFGLSSYVFNDGLEPDRLNSALPIHPETGIGPRYDKVHLVMFGEYIPFSHYLPDNFLIKTLCQEAGRGTGPIAFWMSAGDWASVNICFESTIPHLIRNQILTLGETNREPHVLINISNDGWFRFSRQIDQHFATHVFRAVENRRPYITATNGGFSALIDSRGRIGNIGSRGGAEAVVGEVVLDCRTPPYHRSGDLPAFLCMIFTIVLTVFPVSIRCWSAVFMKRNPA